MRTYLDCYPCFLRQALSAARRAGASDDKFRYGCAFDLPGLVLTWQVWF